MSTVLVTGGSRGIGRATCLAFAKLGYDVAFNYSKDEAGALETVSLLQSEGCEPLVFKCDLADEKKVDEMIGNIFGLEILVNNAGISQFGMIQDTTLENWNRIFAVNTTGAFLCTRAAINKFLKRGSGSIVNVSSIWGETGGACEAAYSASKAALIGFTKAAAKELAPSGINVNCVSCGMIETAMNERLSDAEKKAFLEDVPLGRAGTSEEVAQAIVFLARSKYITGEVLRINGGGLI